LFAGHDNKTTMKKSSYNQSGGFTIIEMVVSIVVVGIIGIGMVSYISDSADSLNSAASRSKLASAGRTAIDRMALELHNALPRSIRVTPVADGVTPLYFGDGDQCIEFIPVRAATNYVNPSFSGGGSSSFDVIEFSPSLEGTVASDAFASIFPTNNTAILYDGDNPNGDYTQWPNFPQRRPIQKISTITDPPDVTLSTVNLVTSHRFRRQSPTKRFFVVDQPVSFCVAGDKLYRYSDYGFFANQAQREEGIGGCSVEAVSPDNRCLPDYTTAIAASPPRIKTLITDSIDNAGVTAFSIGTQSLTRNSLVKIELKFSTNGDSLLLNHEVLTRSVP
jgi:MSHA biogenesis protein MshO